MRSARITFSLLLLAAATLALGQGEGAPAGRYVHVRLDGTVDLGMAPLVGRAVDRAKEVAAEGILLEVDTLGGRVDAALLIRDELFEAGVPVTCWVNHRAISAGALICLSADTIDMAPGATIGAATPVTLGGEEGMKAADEKMISFLRKEFASTAEARGHRKDLAEAMVDADVEIEGVVEKGKLLTLTTTEALELGFAARSSEGRDRAVEAAGFAGRERVELTMNWAEKIARFISEPIIAGLLLSLGFLGLFVELKTPGFGVAGAVGLACLITFFAGHRIVKLAGWEDVGLVVIGLVLLVVEIFVTPGFGIAGILGIISMLTGLLMAMMGRDFETAISLGGLKQAAYTLSGAIVVVAAGALLAVRFLPGSRLLKGRIILDDALASSAGATAFDDLSALIGRAGVARTPLRPSGTVLLDGRRVDAVSEGEIIDAGAAVTVVAVRGGSVVVRPATPA